MKIHGKRLCELKCIEKKNSTFLITCLLWQKIKRINSLIIHWKLFCLPRYNISPLQITFPYLSWPLIHAWFTFPYLSWSLIHDWFMGSSTTLWCPCSCTPTSSLMIQSNQAMLASCSNLKRLCNKQKHVNTSRRNATCNSNFCHSLKVFFKMPKAFSTTNLLCLCFLLYKSYNIECCPSSLKGVIIQPING